MIKEILPSNQSQIIQQTKFTYSPLGKAFEKSNQKNKDQEEKQKKTIQEHRKQIVESNTLVTKYDFYDYDSEKDSSLFSKKKEIFNKLIDKRQMEYLI